MKPLRAYTDSKCVYGYMVLCEECRTHAPKHVDASEPIQPPYRIKNYECEMCKGKGDLE
jgi:hypothetical protein